MEEKIEPTEDKDFSADENGVSGKASEECGTDGVKDGSENFSASSEDDAKGGSSERRLPDLPRKITKKHVRNATVRLTTTALFTALVIVATFYIQIPTGVGGYANLGDAVIFMCALSLGGVPALVAGGIGSMAADLILGYAAYAPFTLVIKGLEGLIAGLLCTLAEKTIKKKQFRIAAEIGALALAALWMVFGYFLVKWLILGDLEKSAIAAALIEVPFNLAQGGISVAIAACTVFLKNVAPKISGVN